jgi:hypothetical protein
MLAGYSCQRVSFSKLDAEECADWYYCAAGCSRLQVIGWLVHRSICNRLSKQPCSSLYFHSCPYIALIDVSRSFEEQQIEQPTGSRPLLKRQVAYMSPRLSVLNNIPIAIPFKTRVSIFRYFVGNDMLNHGVDRHRRTGRTRVSVRGGRCAGWL